MISQIFDGGSFRVLALFVLSPGSRFRRKEIKDMTRMNNVPLDNALSKLVSSGVIKSEKDFYSLNMESVYHEPVMKVLSSQHNELKNLPLNVYLLLADAVAALSTVRRLEAWLFGSYSKLIYMENSDVDMALLMPSPEFKHKERIKNILRKLEKHYGKKIDAHFFDAPAFYRNKKDPLVKEILKDGVRIL